MISKWGQPPITATTALTTALAMLAFAGNTLLCRLALGNELIDAASFTSIRVTSGAVILLAIVWPRWKKRGRTPTNWRAVAMLFTYMVFFSFAYLSLDAATGTLIGFAATQLTMFSVAIKRGERFSSFAWLGLILAGSGVVYLISPGFSAPNLAGTACILLAGIGWAVYTLIGSGPHDPVEATANNFIGVIPLAILVQLLFLADTQITLSGALLAAISGAVTSGLGYVIWYTAIRGLSVSLAATVQLSVPAIAAFGGVMWLGEDLTFRLLIATVLTLGGIAIVLRARAPN